MQLENTYKYHYPEKIPDSDYVRRKILEIKNHLENNNTYFLGATIGNRLYGYVWCYESVFIDEKRMIINSIFVCEEARSTGLGKLMLKEVKRIAIKRNCATISTHYASFNAFAGKFYSENGFVPIRIEMVYKL